MAVGERRGDRRYGHASLTLTPILDFDWLPHSLGRGPPKYIRAALTSRDPLTFFDLLLSSSLLPLVPLSSATTQRTTILSARHPPKQRGTFAPLAQLRGPGLHALKKTVDNRRSPQFSLFRKSHRLSGAPFPPTKPKPSREANTYPE